MHSLFILFEPSITCTQPIFRTFSIFTQTLSFASSNQLFSPSTTISDFSGLLVAGQHLLDQIMRLLFQPWPIGQSFGCSSNCFKTVISAKVISFLPCLKWLPLSPSFILSSSFRALIGWCTHSGQLIVSCWILEFWVVIEGQYFYFFRW